MTTGRLSRAGAGVGAAHEACYLFAYPDPASGGEPWTIAVGHTSRAGPPAVRRGDRVSIVRAFEIYAVDMGGVERDVRAAIKPELAQHQFDAACIFHLNTGAIRSGSIDDKLNRGDEAGALATWSQYVNAAGKRMPGLVTRRAEEIALWKTGRYPARKILIKDTPTGSGRYIAASAIPWRGEGVQPADAVATPVPVIEAERPPVVIVRSPVRPPRVRVPLTVPAAAPSVWSQVVAWVRGLFLNKDEWSG
jgi:GH24 family phage-related lysozyme (muramidase)